MVLLLGIVQGCPNWLDHVPAGDVGETYDRLDVVVSITVFFVPLLCGLLLHSCEWPSEGL